MLRANHTSGGRSKTSFLDCGMARMDENNKLQNYERYVMGNTVNQARLLCTLVKSMNVITCLLILAGCSTGGDGADKGERSTTSVSVNANKQRIQPDVQYIVPGEQPAINGNAVDLEFRNPANRELQKQLDSLKPGRTAFVRPGTYIGPLRIPQGVSIKGSDAATCKILGQIIVQKGDGPIQGASKTRLQHLTLFHMGGRRESALVLDGAQVDVKNCVVCSNGGFSTISANDEAVLGLENSIIVGPTGGYALFSRRRGALTVANCTLVCRGFGIGLMDKSKASVLDCLFSGSQRPGIIRTDSDYTISHCNVSLDKGSTSYPHELIITEIAPNSQDSVSQRVATRDLPKYDSPGLTFKAHRPPTELSVIAFKKNQPEFAATSGSKRADGTVNGLGAFCGAEPGWALMRLGTVSSPRIHPAEQGFDIEELKQVFNDSVVTWDNRKKALRISASLVGVHGYATWKTQYEFDGKPFKPRTGGRGGAEFLQTYYGDLTGIKRMKGTVHLRVFPKIQVVPCKVVGREVKTKMFTYTITGKSVEVNWPAEYQVLNIYGFDKDGDEMKSEGGKTWLNQKTRIVTKTHDFSRELASIQVKVVSGKMERTVPFDLRVDGK